MIGPYKMRAGSPVLFDTLTKFLVLETVVGLEIFSWDTLQSQITILYVSHIPSNHIYGNIHLNIKDLANGSGETTLRGIRCALHEDNERVTLDSL